jgi:TetR/AcrR family transcriptional regulator
MNEQKQRRPYNPEATRATILQAATELFAEHGFQGTSIQDISQAAGYTKSMIFHYFGDKVGLYSAVVERMAALVLSEEEVQMVQALLMDETTPRDLDKLTRLITTVVRGNFEILRAHPQSRRLFLWEAAEEWQTTKLLLQHFPPGGSNRFEQVIREAQAVGLIWPDLDFGVLFTFVQDSGLFYLAMLPRLQDLFRADLGSDEALRRARESLVQLVLNGIFVHPFHS